MAFGAGFQDLVREEGQGSGAAESELKVERDAAVPK